MYQILGHGDLQGRSYMIEILDHSMMIHIPELIVPRVRENS
jgi:hypothetical protein